MILLTRLNGPVFALNPDLVERAECTPDTVITLVDGTKYLVTESLPEVVTLVRHYRASVIVEAQHLAGQSPDERAEAAAEQVAKTNVVRLKRRER